MTANVKTKTGWGPRNGIIRPGIDPNKYMNIGKIDLATGEMKVHLFAAAGEHRLGAGHRAAT